MLGATAGASSSTTWAFVPPMPKELTPALRGTPLLIHAERWPLATKGLRSRSSCGLGSRKFTRGGYLLVLERQNSLDQARNPGCRIEVTDLGLERTQTAKCAVRRRCAKDLRQSGDLNGIAESAFPSMSLDVGDGPWIDSGQRLRQGNHFDLTVHARSRVASFHCAIIVDGRAANYGMDCIAIRQRVGQAFKNNNPSACTRTRAPRIRIDGRQRPSGEKSCLPETIATALRKIDRDAASQSHVAFSMVQGTARGNDGDERRRACCLNGHARTMQIKLVGYAQCTGSPYRCQA